MSYWDISEMASDYDLTLRCGACAAEEGIPDPMVWATQHQLQLCSAPGWAAAWASYRASQPPQVDGEPLPAPGRDPGVISDNMILSATQTLFRSR